MYWVNFFHFYQPPTQKRRWVDRITAESYRRLIEGFLSHPQAKVTLNINAVLLEFWDKYGHHDVLAGLRKLLGRGQIELTGSAKYHPLLPKLPVEEIIRQIRLNEESSRKYLGDLYRPRGFFPPEMAYDRKVAKVAADLGYEWIIAEELSLNHTFGAVDYSKIYEVSGVSVRRDGAKSESSGGNLLKIFFRDRGFSYKLLSGQLGTPALFLDALGDRVSRKEYLLTAMDGETFGHHRPGMDTLLMGLFETPGLEAVLISELADLFEGREVVETLPATWALMSHDLGRGTYLARWEDPENEIHQMQWELTDLAIRSIQDSRFKMQGPELGEDNLSPEQKQWLEARHLLDKALHSDQYWWASAKPWWSLEMIERGARELRDVVLGLPDILENEREKSQSLYIKIITTGFDWQREGKVEELARAEDEAVRMRTDEGLPNLPPEEVDKMIVVIRKEMDEVVKNQEYERAAQLRDRIRELEGYKKDS